MKQVLWSTTALVCLAAICSIAECRSVVKREAHHEIDPNLEKITHEIIDRDKRKVEVVTGVKNAVLGFVFNDKNRQLPVSKGFAWEVSSPKASTTTEDYVTFEPGQPVSLEVPDKLFGSSFTLLTNLSTTVGDFMINSALRTQRLLESMRPFLRTIFGAKGIVIEATTDKPIFSDPNSI